MDTTDSIRTNFDSLVRVDDIFLGVLRTETPLMSDGIYSCPMDPMDSIGTTFDPFLRIDDIFLSVLRTETPQALWNLFVSDGTPTIGVLSPMDVRFFDGKQMMSDGV